MGGYISRINFHSGNKNTTQMRQQPIIIPDDSNFHIKIIIYTMQSLDDKQLNSILDYLKYTNYSHAETDRNIIILYYHHTQPAFLRSNVHHEIISYISSELTIFLLKNLLIEPRMIQVSIDD